MVRLDAQVSSLFGVKQSEARALIASGEVSVNGAPQREPRWQVVLGEEATVTVGGRAPPTGRPFAHRLLLVHKPRGVLSERRRGSAAWNAAHGRRSGEAHGGAHAEAERQTVWDLVPAELRHASLGVFGRLDADTTGLILMGTDGGVHSLLMHPSCGCQKSYLAHLRTDRGDLRLSATAAEEFAAGVTLADGSKCRAASLQVLQTVADPDGGAEPFPSLVRVTLVEGRYHQVKRMLAVCGGAVAALHRERIGGLLLADYPALAEEGSVLLATAREEAIVRGTPPPHPSP